jgi:hypothetical protein
VQAITGELVRGDVGPDNAGFDALGEQVTDQVPEFPSCLGDMLAAVHQGHRQLRVMVPMLDQRERVQNSF